MTSISTSDYFRRDQRGGVTAPDLSKPCSFAEHIVRARGKRTKYTSVSIDPDKIDDFGPVLYQALCPEIRGAGHAIIEHDALMQSLRDEVVNGTKMDRRRALQAQRYAIRRREGLIDWTFDTTGVQRKELITWAFTQIRNFFRVVR
ncbi:MAG: hypothetical protein ABSE20_11010 [Acetobacteraceae bacterium]|jgi:hypothetical protein